MIRFVFSLLFFSLSYASSIAVKDTEISNVLKEYGKTFTDFLVKNIEGADYYIETKKYSIIIKPYISWIGSDYNVCFELYSGTNYLIKIECSTVKNGEEIYRAIKTLLLRLGKFKLKKKDEKQIYLFAISRTEPKFSEYKVESQKGDVLLSYKKIKKVNKDIDNAVKLGKVIVVLDSIYLNREQAKNLFKFLLENYKIKQILIKTQ